MTQLKCSSITSFNRIFMCIKWCIKNGYPLYTNSAVSLSLNWVQVCTKEEYEIQANKNHEKATCFC